MASKLSLLTYLAVALMVALPNGPGGAMAQSTSSGCASSLIALSPCLKYVSGNSSSPAPSCCSQLANVVNTQPQCLCSLLNSGGSSSLGVAINQTLALALPAACNVQTPTASRCNAANGPTPSPATPAGSSPSTPAASPAASPADSSDDTPENPQTPSDANIPAEGGSKTVPGTTDGSSSSATKGFRATLPLLAALLFITSYSYVLA